MNENKLFELLDDLGVEHIGEFKDYKYTIILKDSQDYARYFTKLDRYENLHEVDRKSMGNEFLCVLCYMNDNFKVTLNGNFNDNYYTFVVEEINE